VIPARADVSAPFAWTEVGRPDGYAGIGGLDRARVIQCALSRICGVCGEPLGRPIAFVGTPAEDDRNAFHCPPLHSGCAEDLRRLPAADPGWVLASTAAFEFVRPSAEDADRRPTFQPNSRLG